MALVGSNIDMSCAHAWFCCEAHPNSNRKLLDWLQSQSAPKQKLALSGNLEKGIAGSIPEETDVSVVAG